MSSTTSNMREKENEGAAEAAAALRLQPPKVIVGGAQAMEVISTNNGADKRTQPTTVATTSTNDLPESWKKAARSSSVVANAIARLNLGGGPTQLDRAVQAWSSDDEDNDKSVISIGFSAVSSILCEDRRSWARSSSSSTSSDSSHSSNEEYIVAEPKPTSGKKKGAAAPKKKKTKKKVKLPDGQKTLRGFVSSDVVDLLDDTDDDEGAKSDGSNWSEDLARPKKKKKGGAKAPSKKKASTKKKGGTKQKRLSSFGISNKTGNKSNPTTNKNASAAAAAAAAAAPVSSSGTCSGKKPYSVGSSVVLRNLTSNTDLNGKRGVIKSAMNEGKQDVEINGQVHSMKVENMRGVCPLFLSK